MICGQVKNLAREEPVESLEEIERLFTEGVREAGERTRTAGGEIVTRMNEKKCRIAIECIQALMPDLKKCLIFMILF